ncbi:hypothetical protein BCT47_12120 [Vibrio splendidus]|uniref:Restriction endonuclease subunit S n=1 Tax=Vibrio splendidus TaxID=29497 RepID=A0AB35MXP7_VIBSP|nr:restriction endonuclease subunit S [Vibrio splendidus]MDP2501058.1 restriction endonuclease subunit S [Vibrio splendidus]PMM68733.1 hypothetical protein BCT47_12120 [Vibrio splendidus]
MSELPKGWAEVSIDDITSDVSYGVTAKSDPFEGDLQLLRITDIQDNRVDWSSVPYCKYESKYESSRLKDNDIVVARTGATVGKSFLIEHAVEDSVYASYLIRLRLTKGTLPKYLAKFLYTPSYWQQISEQKAGIGQPNVNGTKLKTLKMPLAPLAEQKRIVEKLDEVLAQVDTIKARLDGIPDLLKRFRQSVLASAVSGKLTEEWRGEDESFGKQVKLGELLKDGPQNGLYKPSRFYGDGTKIFRIDSFYDGELVDWETIKRVDLEEQEVDKYRVNIDDVLVNRVNSIEYLGKCALVRELPENAVFESNIMRMSIDTEKALPAFVTTFLRSIVGLQELRKNAKLAVNQASINQTDVKNCLLQLPKIEEQKEIVRLVDQYFTFADTIETQVKKAQARVDNLTQSILAKAFRGELVAQDPNDEPADKLLERIAEARKEAEALAKAVKKAEAAKKRAAKSA